jgi:UDP-3-O-[3-hydroxymyristoyl] N-acetylglucosamine deacetylase
MELCTAIGSNGFQIQTVEHVLSALSGLEVDNAYLELEGEELPAVDGSAAPFVDLIQSVGRKRQEHPRVYMKIVEPLTVTGSGDRMLAVYPSLLPKISYSIDYPHPLIKEQNYLYHLNPSEFQKNIAAARTFAFSHEVEALWARGLGQGGSLDNTLVLSENGILNETGLRFSDECVRHKILDLIGDLVLLGVPVIGHFIADRAGHKLHGQLVQRILEHPETWILVNANHEKTESFPNSILSSLTSHQTPLPVYSSL